MITEARKAILDHYDVNYYGIIQNKGKYEQEMLYVPYFWGQNDEDERIGDPDYIEWRVWEVTEDDERSFPELRQDAVTHVALRKHGDGFIISELLGTYYDLEEFQEDVADEIWDMKQDAEEASQ